MNQTAEIGPCRLYLGDCRVVLPTLAEKFDLVFTSPPYNLGNTAHPTSGFAWFKKLGHYDDAARLGRKRGGCGKWDGGALAHGYGAHDDAMPHDEYVAWQKAVLRQCWDALSDDGAVFYNHKPRVLNGVLVSPFTYCPEELPVRQVVIWARAGGMNFSPAFYLPTHEWIVVLAKPDWRLRSKGASGVGDVWYVPQESDTEHPAPFPLRLPLKAIETTAAQTVLDPFMGSGTTLVACVREGRTGVGVELDHKHFELACRRVERAVRDQRDDLFPVAKEVYEPPTLFADADGIGKGA